MTKRLTILILLLSPAAALAQEPLVIVDQAAPSVVRSATPYFFAAIVAGLILAAAFQMLLTNLSLAAGLNILGPIGRKSREPETRTRPRETTALASAINKVGAGFGIWALVTSTIALFFAAWLAVEVSYTGSYLIGAIIGLVVWGLFYALTMSLEAMAISSLAGSLLSAARSGMSSMYAGAARMLGRSTEEKAADTAAEITSAVREELFGGMDVRKKLDEYVRRLEPRELDVTRIRQELAKLLDDVEIRAMVDREEPFLDVETITAAIRTDGHMDERHAREVAGKVSEAIRLIREEASKDKDTVSKVADAAMRVAGIPTEKAQAARSRIEEYLRSTGKEELQPETIKHDIELLLHNPKQGAQSLKSHMQSLDSDTVATVIAETTSMSKDDAVRAVNRVRKYMDEMTGTATSAEESALTKLRSYLQGLKRPGLDYEGIGHDLGKLFYDPAAGADALLGRMKSIDRDTVKSVIASRRDMSDEDAEMLLQRIEHARDEVVAKAQEMRDRVESKLQEARAEAEYQAEEARKATANAAWWALAVAVVSGIAAAGGGLIAVAT